MLAGLGLVCVPGNCKGGPYSDDNANYAVYANYGGNFGNTETYYTPTYNPPPVFVPTMCNPLDIGCVEGNVAGSVAYQQAEQQASANNNYTVCMSDNYGADVCRARWPIGYAGNVPFNNLTLSQQIGQMVTPTQAAQQFLANPNNQDIPGFGSKITSVVVPYLDQLKSWETQLVSSGGDVGSKVNTTVQGSGGNDVGSKAGSNTPSVVSKGVIGSVIESVSGINPLLLIGIVGGGLLLVSKN